VHRLKACATKSAVHQLYYERNLPHWHPAGRLIFVTWRLYGSLPRAILERFRTQEQTDPGRAFVELDREMDRACTGPQWLRLPTIAPLVVEALRNGESNLGCYVALAYVVMPNHVHLLLEPKVPLSKITKGIKGSTARLANALLGRQGKRFWQDESFDHWVRSGRGFDRIQSYIELNPVKAGLAAKAELWPWSSAARATGSTAF
jgi:putative transposase